MFLLCFYIIQYIFKKYKKVANLGSHVIIGFKKEVNNLFINWSLYNNDKLVFKNKLTDFKYEKEQYLLVNDKYGSHKIDLKSKIYEKIDGNVIFRIDFVNNLCIIILDSDKKFEFTIDTNWHYQNNIWTLSYKLEDENKQIIIELKE